MSNFISSVWKFEDSGRNETGYLTHDLLRWYGKLIPPLVSKLVEMYSDPGETVLANFAGSGTVLLESSLLGRNVIGIDANPLSVLVSSVKTQPIQFDAQDVMDVLMAHLPKHPARDYGRDAFLQKWFERAPYEDLDRLIGSAEQIQDPKIRDAVRLCIASIVKRNSRVDSRCVNHIVVDKSKKPSNVIDDIRRKLGAAANDTQLLSDLNPEGHVTVSLGNARALELDSDSVDFILSHPPYLGAIDYRNMYQLENLLLGFDDATFDQLDISTTSMRKYLEAMRDVFSEMNRVLKPGRYAAVVIGDNRKNGSIQPTFSYFIQDAINRLDMKLKDIFIWVTQSKAGMNVARRGNHIDHNYILILEKSNNFLMP